MSGSYKVIRSLLNLAPSLKWLEIDKSKQVVGVEEEDEMWSDGEEQIEQEVALLHHSWDNVEAFILSRPFAFATENLFRIKNSFPNLLLLGSMENWNGSINEEILDKFAIQNGDVKLIFKNRIYNGSGSASSKFNPWKYIYVNDVGCTPPSKNKVELRPKKALQCMRQYSNEDEKTNGVGEEDGSSQLIVSPSVSEKSKCGAFEWGWRSSGNLDIFAVKSSSSRKSMASSISQPSTAINLRNSISFQDLIENGFEIPEHRIYDDEDDSSTTSCESSLSEEEEVSVVENAGAAQSEPLTPDSSSDFTSTKLRYSVSFEDEQQISLDEENRDCSDEDSDGWEYEDEDQSLTTKDLSALGNNDTQLGLAFKTEPILLVDGEENCLSSQSENPEGSMTLCSSSSGSSWSLTSDDLKLSDEEEKEDLKEGESENNYDIQLLKTKDELYSQMKENENENPARVLEDQQIDDRNSDEFEMEDRNSQEEESVNKNLNSNQEYDMEEGESVQEVEENADVEEEEDNKEEEGSDEGEVEYDLEWYWDYESKAWLRCDPSEWEVEDWNQEEEEEKEMPEKTKNGGDAISSLNQGW